MVSRSTPLEAVLTDQEHQCPKPTPQRHHTIPYSTSAPCSGGLVPCDLGSDASRYPGRFAFVRLRLSNITSIRLGVIHDLLLATNIHRPPAIEARRLFHHLHLHLHLHRAFHDPQLVTQHTITRQRGLLGLLRAGKGRKPSVPELDPVPYMRRDISSSSSATTMRPLLLSSPG